MDKSGRFAIFSSSSFFGEKNGCRNCRKFGFNKGIVNRIFSFFRFYCWLTLWLFCFISSYALAEFSSSDLNDIESYLDLIYERNGDIHNKVNDIKYDVGDIKSDADNMRQMLQNIYNGFGYSYNGAYTLRQDMQENNEYLIDIHDNITGLYDGLTSLESIYARLGEILDALDGNTGGSGESAEINQNWVKEDTFNAYVTQYTNQFNDFRDMMGLGYRETIRDLLYNIVYPGGHSSFFRYYNYFDSSLGGSSPYPGVNDINWGEMKVTAGYNSNGNDFVSRLSSVIAESSKGIGDAIIGTSKKSAWNDWYSHTNLISTLYTLSAPPKNYIDSSLDIGSVNEETGELSITYNDAEGGSPPTPELIDTKITFTNDFAQLETKAEEAEDILKDINYSKMKEIYKVPEGIESQGYRDYSQTETIPDYRIQYGNSEGHSFVFNASHRQIYNSLLSPALLNKLRVVFSKLWFFLSVYFNFVLFKIFGKVND